MKRRGRCDECRVIALFPVGVTTIINAPDVMLETTVQIRIPQRTQDSSTPKSISFIMRSGSNDSNSSGSNPSGSAFGTGSSGFNKSWDI